MSFKSQTPLNIAEAKRRFSEIVNEVVYHDKQFVIARHGKPVVGIIPASLIPPQTSFPKQGFLTLVGIGGLLLMIVPITPLQEGLLVILRIL